MVGAQCRAAGRAEAALPGGPHWTVHPPVSPEQPSWPRTKHRATCAVRKDDGTLKILPGCGNQTPTSLIPLLRALGMAEMVMTSRHLSKGLLARVSQHSFSRPPGVSQCRAHGLPHMPSFPATFTTLGPLSDNQRRERHWTRLEKGAFPPTPHLAQGDQQSPGGSSTPGTSGVQAQPAGTNVSVGTISRALKTQTPRLPRETQKWR